MKPAITQEYIYAIVEYMYERTVSNVDYNPDKAGWNVEFSDKSVGFISDMTILDGPPYRKAIKLSLWRRILNRLSI